MNAVVVNFCPSLRCLTLTSCPWGTRECSSKNLSLTPQKYANKFPGGEPYHSPPKKLQALQINFFLEIVYTKMKANSSRFSLFLTLVFFKMCYVDIIK